MQLAELLAELLRVLLDFVPRPQMVLKTHRAVVFFLGRWAREVGPGFYVAWPAFWQIHEFPTVRTTLNLCGQSLTTCDGQTVIAAAVVVYRVDSVYDLLVETYEPDEAISDMALAAVAEVVCSKSLAELNDIDEANDALSEATTEQLAEFGVGVVRAVFSDLTAARAFRNWQNEHESD